MSRATARRMARLLDAAADISDDKSAAALRLVAEYVNPLVVPPTEPVGKKGRVLKWNGLTIHIEYDKGDMRHGRKLPAAYGYIAGSHAMDNDGIDVFIGPEPHKTEHGVYVARQLGGNNFDIYDEDKVMLGFRSYTDARDAFIEAQQEKRLGSMDYYPVNEFLRSVKESRTAPQPVGGYRAAQWDQTMQRRPEIDTALSAGQQIWKLFGVDPTQPKTIESCVTVDEQEMRKSGGKYDHISFTPPEGVASAASRGLEYRKKASPSNKGGLTQEQAAKEGIGSGVQRATNLKNRDAVSPEVIRQMVAFFSRHEKNKTVEAEHKDTPWNDKGYVAWLLWGGDAGKAWAERVAAQMDAADKKD